MNKLKCLLVAVLMLCLSNTPKAKAAPPCFLFTISGSRNIADVELNGHSIKGISTTFMEGDEVYGTYGGCPPSNQLVATVTVYRWDIQSNSYLIVNYWSIVLGSSCESGSWTLHTNFQSQQPPCGTANASYTINQLYCPCGQ